jgi:hypothetical protein
MDVEKERVEDWSGRRNRRMGREVMIALLLSVERLRGGGTAISLLAERLQPITELGLQCRHAF